MAKVYAIKEKTEEGIVLDVFNDKREKVETVLIMPTADREWMAVTETGETFGYRHASVDLALQKIAQVRDYTYVWLSAKHPVARQFVGA